MKCTPHAYRDASSFAYAVENHKIRDLIVLNVDGKIIQIQIEYSISKLLASAAMIAVWGREWTVCMVMGRSFCGPKYQTRIGRSKPVRIWMIRRNSPTRLCQHCPVSRAEWDNPDDITRSIARAPKRPRKSMRGSRNPSLPPWQTRWANYRTGCKPELAFN